jgi:hypothetical protein
MRLRHNGRRADTLEKFGEQATSLVQAIAEQAATTATAGAGRAKEVSATLTTAAKERAPDRAELSEQVSAVQQKIAEDVAPTVREVALQAASLAIELWQAGRTRAGGVTETAQHGVVAQAANVKQAAGRRATSATGAVTERASAVSDLASDAAYRAKSASKHAAETTVHTTKDTGALIFWLGAAAALVYYALLNEKRRNQVLRFANRSLREIKKAIDGVTSEPRGYPEAQ